MITNCSGIFCRIRWLKIAFPNNGSQQVNQPFNQDQNSASEQARGARQFRQHPEAKIARPFAEEEDRVVIAFEQGNLESMLAGHLLERVMSVTLKVKRSLVDLYHERHGDHQRSARLEQIKQGIQQPMKVVDVLQYVHEDQHVKTALTKWDTLGQV